MKSESKSGRFGFTARAVVLAVVFLLLANLVLGYALVNQSRSVIKNLINDRMLDVSNTAASMIDGDVLESISSEDEGSGEYQKIWDTLAVFRDNIDLEYIYAVRKVGERSFIFTIDPSYGTPGEFGERIGYTDALYTASLGTAAVDEEPYQDAWGRFYSSYSPVFDSAGNVAGIVACDFSAEWYEQQVATQTRTAVTIGGMSLLVGALVVVIITSRLRKRFRVLFQELSGLAGDIEDLTREVAASTGAPAVQDEPSERAPAAPVTVALMGKRAQDDIDALGNKIRLMQGELRDNIEIIREQAYTDALTGIGNKASYLDALEHAAGADGASPFGLAVLDINGLKQVNDTFGHHEGDRLIKDAARAIVAAFGEARVFRIGGDEFVAVVEGADAREMRVLIETFEHELAQVNSSDRRRDLPVEVSKGFAVHKAGSAEGAQEVMDRADEEMYADKAAYYALHGDRRTCSRIQRRSEHD